jgi:hypothetical protein
MIFPAIDKAELITVIRNYLRRKRGGVDIKNLPEKGITVSNGIFAVLPLAYHYLPGRAEGAQKDF